MSEPILLPVKTGSISKRDRAALRKGGIIVIEHENPTELKLLRPLVEVESSDLLRLALKALCVEGGYDSKGNEQREAFAIGLNQLLNPAQQATATKESK